MPGSYSFMHCLSRLKPFLPCVCAFSYLSSSIIFMAEHVNILEYTEHFWVYMDLENQGATNVG